MGILEFESQGGGGVHPVEVDTKTLYVRSLSAFDQDLFEVQFNAYKESVGSLRGVRAFYVAWCLCDESGKPEFNAGNSPEASQEFIGAVVRVGNLPASIVQPVYTKATQVNGLSKSDVEELEKN